MTEMALSTLQPMVEAIVQEVAPEQIFLFGSQARDEADAGSDVDLLVVERLPFGTGRSRFEEINRIYQAVSPFRIPTDILLYSSDEFVKWRGSVNHVVGRCHREGKLLYERS